jgi:hypothetical protein
MNGASAGVGGEAPLVYKAWKGNNVSGMPLLPMSLPLCAFFFPPLVPLLRVWRGSVRPRGRGSN